jgi:hypothetical protein
MTLALICEMVNLIADFLTCLACEKRVRFNNASVVWLKTRGVSRGPECVKNAITPRHIFGIEIPHTARRIKTYLVLHNFSKFLFL